MADKNFGLVTTVDDEGHGDDSPTDQKTIEGHATGGKKDQEEFQRYISLSGILNFGFTFQAAWECTGLTLSLIFLNGGPVTLVWGTIISGIGHTLVALSLAEMASMDPTVGAQYRWSARFASKWPEFWGMMQGWVTTFAWMTSPAAPLSLLASCTQALISFHNPNYVPAAWETTLLMWAFLVLAIVCNLYLRRILNALETIGGICHVLFFIACVIILTTTAERSSADYVFKRLISDASGWNNPGLSFQLGLLTVLLPLSGYDSVLHMIDETRKPRERVPKSMVGAVIFNTVLQLGYAITLMFCIGDEEAVSGSLQPLLTIYYQATKSKAAATVVLLMHMFQMLVGLFNTLASSSRLTWSFARDRGLPFSSFFSRINPRLQIPLQSLGLIVIVSMILSLINLGSSLALGAILALQTLGLLVSYFIPIFLLVLRKLSGRHPRYGPFKLGRWGLPINLFSLCFCAYAALWAAMPTSRPVTTVNMNYAGPVLLGLVLLCLVDWFTYGHKRFVVPTGQYNIEMEDESEMTGRSDSKNAHRD